MRLTMGVATAARARTMVCDDSSSMSKAAATPSMWRATIERLRRHIAEMVELAGAARRLDPYAQTAGGCAPSGAAAPGRSEFAANTFLTLCVMHNGAALAVRPSPTRGTARQAR